MIFLSFCIPTYQRKDLLRETLESILVQELRDIEIVISDNGSLDGTEQMIRTYQQNYKNIRYFRFDKTVEAGKNLMHVVSMAQGVYGWLLTDDDTLMEGSLLKVMSMLKGSDNLTGMSLHALGFDRFLKGNKTIRYPYRVRETKYFDSAEECISELGAWLGFWSAQIVNLKKWKEAFNTGKHERYIGYHHLYLIVKMIKEDPKWIFFAEPCIKYRADNETFSKEHGLFNRYRIDVESYPAIIQECFGMCSSVEKRVMNDVLRSYLFWQIAGMKIRGIDQKILRQVYHMTIRHFWKKPIFWIRFIPLIAMPTKGLLGLRFLYRKLWQILSKEKKDKNYV